MFEASSLPAVVLKVQVLIVTRGCVFFSLQRQRDAANFKAKPAAILTKEPFVPKHCDKSMVGTDDVILHSDRRAAERQVPYSPEFKSSPSISHSVRISSFDKK